MGNRSVVAAKALAAVLLAGCGGSSSPLLGGGDGSGANNGSHGGTGGTSSNDMDATVSGGGDTDAPVFGTGSSTDDAGVITTQGACLPGDYQGQFMTYVGAGADGGSASGPFAFMWNGNLAIDLSAQKITMTTTSGGEVPVTTSTTTLSIADGGALDGGDMFGGTFYANLSGTLDCAPDAGPPYHFTATLSNGGYKNAFFTIPIVGNMTADYQDGDGGLPPMLVNGRILVGGIFMDGGTPLSSASGTWSATRVSSP
jgi:hypothetical protein